MLLGYAAMVLYRPKCWIITFFLGFGFLIGWQVFHWFLLRNFSWENFILRLLYSVLFTCLTLKKISILIYAFGFVILEIELFLFLSLGKGCRGGKNLMVMPAGFSC